MRSLTKAQVLKMHSMLIQKTGGSDGISDDGLLDSALNQGSVVTTSKNSVDHIVTEFGVVRLRGMTISERAKALISIAHPDFRESLTFEAKKRGLV